MGEEILGMVEDYLEVLADVIMDNATIIMVEDNMGK